MALKRANLSGLDLGWIGWIDEAEGFLAFIEPILETLVDIRHQSWWRVPFLRRLRPPAEVEQALEFVRQLRSKIG